MARMIIRGFEEFEEQISRLADPEISKEIVMAGAQPVADEIRRRIQSLPETVFRKLSKDEKFDGVPKSIKKDLLNSLGIAPADIDRNGNTNTKVGFSGYGSYPTRKYSKGLPNALAARAIESGSSVRIKTPFVRPAVTKARKLAIEEMQNKLNEKIQAL